MIKAVMIIWMGVGQAQTFDTLPFNSMAECTAARGIMADAIADKWDSWSYNYGDSFRRKSICVSLTGDN